MGPARIRGLAVAAIVALEALAAGAFGTGARAAILADPPIPLPSPAATARSVARPARTLLVKIEHAMPVTARPGGGTVVGTMPEGSPFYDTPTVAWIRRVSIDGRFGLVDVPYAPRVSGWIRLRGLERSGTRLKVVADLSAHHLVVRRGGRLVLRTRAATGAALTPTPVGRYFVTDRIAFPGGGSLGTFAFGISGIQPQLPPGWSGGDQLAIHGTDDPSSIGTSASAGCLRVSEAALARLRRLLRLGTPVIVRA